MKVQLKPNAWSCVLTAFAMAIDLGYPELISVVGHDGSEIINPDVGDPAGRRGFHQQELIQACWWLNHTVTTFQLQPVLKYAGTHQEVIIDMVEQCTNIVLSSRGVILGKGAKTWHALAYENGICYDPDNGKSFEYNVHSLAARSFAAAEVLAVR